MTEPVIIDAGTLEFSDADMTATGLLIPYGVKCRSNLGEFTFAAGDVNIPADLTGMSLNVEHKREQVAGGFTRAWEQPEGVFATFKYSDTPTGRQAYADGKSGKRRHLSAEVSDVRIQGGKALPGANLFAGAQVERPAFEGATLLAAEDTPQADEPAETTSRYVTEYTDADGATWRRVEETKAETVETDTGTETTVTTTVIETTDAAQADTTNTNQETTLNATATDTAQTVTVPATFLGSAPKAKEMKPEEVELGTIFASIHALKTGVDAGAAAEAATLLAALSDITTANGGGLASAGLLQPAWVGKLWQGKRYVRKYMDLFTHLYGGIQLGGRKGFNIAQGSALVQKWNGNKSDLPSGTASTSLRSATVQAYGYGADYAREWWDLEGGAEVLQAFFEGVADSYAQVTDEDALRAAFTAASKTSAALDRLVAPGTFPSVAGHDYPTAMGMVIQAIEAVSDANDDAASVVVNPVAWNQLLYTPKDLIPEYVSFGVTAGTGTGNAEGKVTIKKAAQSFFPGTVATAPQVLAGAKGAIEFREQGQTPIQIDALDIARGGVDKATIGYLETFVVRPESLVLIGTKP